MDFRLLTIVYKKAIKHIKGKHIMKKLCYVTLEVFNVEQIIHHLQQNLKYEKK